MQEWGRKSWKNLYEGTSSKLTELKLEKFNDEKIDYTEKIQMKNATSKQILNNISRIFEKQYILYKTTFRDGQYTAKRKFDIHKKMELEIDEKFRGILELEIEFEINHNKKDSFILSIKESGYSCEKSQQLINELQEKIKKYEENYRYHEKQKCDLPQKT